ncbi:RagB/SusD family nutrient uptake outer membrane protein [Puteibacter caeruleilacunae]|nr:RagB/SusD family nutrient uptake outer membrane protein [Puteibacter caeruleilacunae]
MSNNQFSMKYIGKLFILSLLIGMIISCEEVKLGGEFLDQQPTQVGFTTDSMFTSKQNADQVLTKAYSYAKFPFFSFFWPARMSGYGKGTLMDITDLGQQYGHSGAKILYYTGNYSASSYHPMVMYSYQSVKEGESNVPGDGAWNAIKYANKYLDHVDDIPDMTDEEKKTRKGEAHCLIAYRYIEMLKHLGGVPWIGKAYGVNEIPLTLERESVESLVNKIVDMLDLAASELPWHHSSSSDHLRFTKASALGFKLEVLLFAASPIFNADEPYHPDAAPYRYNWYGDYDVERWKRAEAAGKEFMDALTANGYYEMVEATGTTHRDYRQAYIDGYHTRGKKECLYCILPTKQVSEDVKTEWNELAMYAPWSYRGNSVSLEYVNMFPMLDGTDFPADFNWSNPPFNPFFDADGNPNRDPRLYETVLVNGDYYQNRTAQMWAQGNGYQKGLDLAANNRTAFHMRKFILERNNATSSGKPLNYAVLRLPEVFLSYAEAINEANGAPNATAYEMINKVRNRVGMPNLPAGMNKEQFRAALIKERALELGFEECRWFDLVRWKMEGNLTKKLHGLKITKKNDTAFAYKVFELPSRYWMTNWDSKWFFQAFPNSEVDKQYGLSQNPGW